MVDSETLQNQQAAVVMTVSTDGGPGMLNEVMVLDSGAEVCVGLSRWLFDIVATDPLLAKGIGEGKVLNKVGKIEIPNISLHLEAYAAESLPVGAIISVSGLTDSGFVVLFDCREALR